MADSRARLNPISCERCRRKKIRCSRALPSCSHCDTHEAECRYPKRAKRTVVTASTDVQKHPDDALSAILQRLQRVEQNYSISKQSPDQANQSAFVGDQLHNGSHTGVHSASDTANALSESVTSPISLTLMNSIASTEFDFTASLKGAVNEVQKLKMRSLGSSVVTEPIDISPDMAKKWIENYFIIKPKDTFFNLLVPKLIRLIPDILDLPHVHLDPAILVVYYGVLYHGCFLDAEDRLSQGKQGYARKLYIACLRTLPAWQREAQGSTTDFMACLFMARAAFECFDFDLAWKLYKYGSKYANSLNLHNLDGEDSGTLFNQSKTDADRRNFWEIIHIDMCFRLLFNKPPVISESMENWKVNLPTLALEAEQHAVSTMVFLFNSRITFVIVKFFQIVEENDYLKEDGIKPQIEELAREIEALCVEWQVDDWIRRSTTNDFEAWQICDSALTAYTTIIWMFRRMGLSKADTPNLVRSDIDMTDSPYVLRAARHIVDLIDLILTRYSFVASVSFVFGLFQAYIPCAYLASHAQDIEDLRRLERVTIGINSMSETDPELIPLLQTLQSITAKVRKRLNTAITE